MDMVKEIEEEVKKAEIKPFLVNTEANMKLNVRSHPEAGNNVIGLLEPDDMVEVVDPDNNHNGFYRIKYKGGIAYVMRDKVKPAE